MSKKEYNNLLKALDNMNKCLFCVKCRQFCKNPVTLSKCFHLICFDHFHDLSHCPKCKVSINDCTTWSDDKLNGAVDAAKNLSAMFDISKVSNNPVKKHTTDKITNSLSETETHKPNVEAPIPTPSKVEKRNNKGETELHRACRMKKAAKVAELLSKGANTNTKDDAGWTPLHKVVQNGRQDLLKLLLKHSALVNVPGKGNESPLHEAIRYNHIEIAKELLTHGADTNARNSKGETPLTLAAPNIKAIITEFAEKRSVKEQAFDLQLVQRQIDIDWEDIRVYSASPCQSINNKLKTLTKHHSNLHIEPKFTNKVTHLIVDDKDGFCEATVEVLLGIVNSLWILTSKWVTESTEKNLESFEKHEVFGITYFMYRGPRFARYNKYKLLPGIFSGCHFYFHNFDTAYKISDNLEVDKAILTKLVTDGGGKVLRRAPELQCIPEEEKLVPYHAKRGGKLSHCSHYIIYKDTYEPRYDLAHLKALPVGWLIKCIESYELHDPWFWLM